MQLAELWRDETKAGRLNLEQLVYDGGRFRVGRTDLGKQVDLLAYARRYKAVVGDIERYMDDCDPSTFSILFLNGTCGLSLLVYERTTCRFLELVLSDKALKANARVISTYVRYAPDEDSLAPPSAAQPFTLSANRVTKCHKRFDLPRTLDEVWAALGLDALWQAA